MISVFKKKNYNCHTAYKMHNKKKVRNSMGFHKIFPSQKNKSPPPKKKCSPSSTCGSYQCNHLDQSSRFEASVMYQTSPPAPGRCLRLKTKTWRNDGKSHGIFCIIENRKLWEICNMYIIIIIYICSSYEFF